MAEACLSSNQWQAITSHQSCKTSPSFHGDQPITVLDFVSDAETLTLLDMITEPGAYLTPPDDERVTMVTKPTNQKKRSRFQFSDQLVSPAKRSRMIHMPETRSSSFIVKAKEMRAFFNLLDDSVIGAFLSRDSCRRVSDKYLLAMTFAYFKRAKFTLAEYTRMNFFLSLYLANDMEEDEEDGKYEIFPWALGPEWQSKYPAFIRKRDKLWQRIGYRAVVSKKCCDEIMAIEVESVFWRRDRPEHHAGAERDYMKSPDDDGYPRGPDGSPRLCDLCDTDRQYDSASPDSPSWCISTSGESSPGLEFDLIPTDESQQSSRFDMDGLKDTLDEYSIWAHGSEE